MAPYPAAIAELIPAAGFIPGPSWPASFLLYAGFVIHIILINILLGLVLINFFQSLFGQKKSGENEQDLKQFSILPKVLAFAVNMGIPALLFIQVLFGSFFYSSSVLMAFWWLAVMPLTIFAYYGLYLNAAKKTAASSFRPIILGLVAIMLLLNAFILSNNVTLMQSPALFSAYATQANGTFLNIADMQLWARYLHILLSSLAVGGLCIALPAFYSLRRSARTCAPILLFEKAQSRMQSGLNWFFWSTLAQLPVGCFFLFSLPPEGFALFTGGNAFATVLFIFCLCLTLLSLYYAKREAPAGVTFLCFMLILGMSKMRSQLRECLLAPFARTPANSSDDGALMFFTFCLLFSGLIVFQLIRLYTRQYSRPKRFKSHALLRKEPSPVLSPAETIINSAENAPQNDQSPMLVNELTLVQAAPQAEHAVTRDK